MPVTVQYPYAPDQRFGVRFAADEERLDRFLAELAARNADLPGPVTTAIALEAAVEMHRACE
jgi:hypothetical protein